LKIGNWDQLALISAKYNRPFCPKRVLGLAKVSSYMKNPLLTIIRHLLSNHVIYIILLKEKESLFFSLYKILASLIVYSFLVKYLLVLILYILLVYIVVILKVFFLVVSLLFIISRYILYIEIIILSFL
jgi:hypothetical protein